MSARLSYAWRALRTGLAFAIFGVAALVLAVRLTMLRRRARDRDADRCEMRAQHAIHRVCRAFVGVMRVLGLMTLDASGVEDLRRPGPRLVVANHPGLIDVVLLLAEMPQADCVVSRSWARNPFLRGVAAAAGYLRNDGGAEVVDEAVRRVRTGRAVLLFPEGTRSPASGLGPFRRGAAHVALAVPSDLVPIVLRYEPRTLMKGQKWYDVPDRPFHVTLRVERPFAPKDVLRGDERTGIAARRVTAALRRFFLERVEGGTV